MKTMQYPDALLYGILVAGTLWLNWEILKDDLEQFIRNNSRRNQNQAS